jgi:hypothetical protein
MLGTCLALPIKASTSRSRLGQILLAKRKPSRRKSSGGARRRGPAKSVAPGDGVGVRRSADGRGWVLVHPRGARDRAEDLDEVREMVAVGELDVAIDELRWLVGGCSEFVEAHALLGELAFAGNDLALARGHFGVAVQLGLKALKQAKAAGGPLPYSQPANRPFFEAARGLLECLAALKLFDKAEELVTTIGKLDPRDPVELRKALDDARSGGLPIIELQPDFRNRAPNDQ